MAQQNQWCQESDQLLRYLYQDLSIFNWAIISKELRDRRGISTDASECRDRYVKKYGPVLRDQWTIEQEKELYRLHNQNGNRWAVISQNLLGRNDNCVKNHFYSKLRKSLRTLNKIAKLYLKKQTKEISDLVLYKLTEVTDQSLKESTDVPKSVILMSFDLKNRLLDYDMDQKQINENLDYIFEKELLQGLNEFNKIYKKKPKKEKISQLGGQNLKKMRTSNKKNLENKKKASTSDFNEDSDSQKIIRQSHCQQNRNQYLDRRKSSENFFGNLESLYSFKSVSEHSRISGHKRTVNYLIKAPSQQQQTYQKTKDKLSSINLKDSQKNIGLSPQNQIFSFTGLSLQLEQKPRNKVEDILKAEGILENAEYGLQNYFRRTNSVRSFSICEQSPNPDMFGQDATFGSGYKDLSEMQNESQQFFSNQQNE